MALSSTFQERLQQMEETRTQRLALLQAEKELQFKKSHLLAEKLANQRRMQQRCLLLERQSAELGFRILAKKSEIDTLDARYHAATREIRDLKGSIAELEEREKKRDRFYEEKRMEMEEFNEQKRRFSLDTRQEVQKLRDSVSELKSTLEDLQKNDKYQTNAEITVAEARKAELLAEKERLDIKLASAYELRMLLQKQLQKMLTTK